VVSGVRRPGGGCGPIHRNAPGWCDQRRVRNISGRVQAEEIIARRQAELPIAMCSTR
jgi:hypothetical protein